jgi:transposase
MTKEELRTRVEAELLAGAEPRELAEKYGMAYNTIQLWKKKLFAEKPTEAISDLTHETTATLELIRTKAKEEAPTVAGKIDKIIDGVEGLQSLEEEFQATMHKAVMRAKEFLDSDDITIKEWQMITSTLGSAYAALFNSKGTTVNVAQTTVNMEKEAIDFFKASKRTI